MPDFRLTGANDFRPRMTNCGGAFNMDTMAEPMLRVSNPPPKPLLVYDGDCAFCKLWVARWQEETGDAVDYAPLQQAAARFPQVPREEFERAVKLIEPDGSVWSG